MPDSAQSSQQDIRAISVRFQPKLAAKLPQPQHGRGRPVLGDEEDEPSCDTAHSPHRTDTQVFDIQALLRVEALPLFHAAPQMPIGVDLLGDGHIE